MLHNVSGMEFWVQLIIIFVILIGLYFVLTRAFYLQLSEDAHLGRKARAKGSNLTTDLQTYLAQIPIGVTLMSPSPGIDLLSVWLELRILEQQLQIVSQYRKINLKRKRAYLVVTIGVCLIAAFAEVGTINLSSLYDRYQPNVVSGELHQ